MVKGKFQTYFPFEKNCLTYSCLHCRAHLARHDDLISKSFQGSQGRAYLFNQAVNIRCAEAKQRVLLTGLHFVADIFCAYLSDSGRVSDYCHNSTSTSATENIGHFNLVCSTDNNNDNNDSDVDNIDYVALNNVNMDKTSARNYMDDKTRSTDNQTSIIVDNNAHKDGDEEHLVENPTKSKSPTPVTIKLYPEGQKDNPTDNDNSGYSCLETDAYDILENINNRNNRRPMDDLCLRKLSQYSTPQARRVSKINSQNLRVTFNSNLGKLNRKRPKYRLRASSASPSRDFLLLTGSDNDDEEEESTDNRSSDFIDFNRQTHNIVQVQD
ncbi:Protein yippee-like 1 [Schistosoma japonicum]|nr:Protein yippee-like 1 [Schistosoma japonicum]KAH8855062.1 Protein yippee-like 1 [Schistosoma japonicum]